MSKRALALIPAYNEARRILPVIRATQPHVSEVVVIDDGSSDDTAAVAEMAGARVLRHAGNRGKGAAIVTGLQHLAESGADYAIFLDADGQHDPAEMPSFLSAARETGAGIVIGNRMQHTEQMPWLRRTANRLTSWVTGRLARQPVPDSQCGYRLVHRAVLPALHLATSHFETETEMLIQAGRAGHRIASVPVKTIYFAGRSSRIRPWRDTLRFCQLAWRAWYR
jgi:glycosyltransferase involved in cell wall biosynthesis